MNDSSIHPSAFCVSGPRSDVTIIGGGPAGSVAGVLLARGGWDVTLIEQSRFPRDKVCGECLSALGFDVLTRLGLDRAFMDTGAIRLDRAFLHAANGSTLPVRLPRPMWGLSRGALDTLLLDTARTSGVRVRQPARCESLASSGDPTLRLRDLTTNAVETLISSHLLLADGKGAFADQTPNPTGDFGIKAHFTGIDGPRDAIELFGVEGSYGGLAAIEVDRWNAAFSVPAWRIKASGGNLDALFDELKRENPTLAQRLAHAERVGDWLASPLPRFGVSRRHWPANVVPLGNAAAAIEPIGGEGMGLAMRSAEVAAECLLTGGDVRRLQKRFDQLWRTRRAGCRAAGVLVSHRRASTLLLRNRMPSLAVRAALRVIGK